MATLLDDPTLPQPDPAPQYAAAPTYPGLLQSPVSLHRTAPVVPPPQLTAAQLDALNQQQDREAWAKNNPFFSGVASGWQGLKAGANGLVGAGQAALGFDNAARNSLHRRAADVAEQQQFDTGSPQSLSDVHGIGDAFDWAEHQLGAAVPGMAAVLGTTLATGGIGDLAGLGAGAALRGVGERLGADAIEREAGELAAKQGVTDAADAATQATIRQQAAQNVAERAGSAIPEGTAPEDMEGFAQGAFADNAMPRLKQLNAAVQRSNASPVGSLAAMAKQLPGATLGGAVVSGEGATQDLNPNMTDAQLTDASRKALGGAIGEGALMALPGLALMRRYGVGAAAEKVMAQKMARPLWKRLVANSVEQGGVMGGTNVAADAANKVLHNWITGQGLTKGVVTPDALSGYLNDLAGGAVTGALMGAPAGLKADDVPLPALGRRAKMFRLFQKIGKSQARAAKPGEPVNDDGTPIQQSPIDAANNVDVDGLYHSKLDQIQRARSQWEQDTFAGIKPYDLTQDDNTQRLSIGTTNNTPGAKLFDPAAMQVARQTYPGKDDGMQAALLSLLPDTGADAAGRTARSNAIDATTKAVKEGFDSLSAPEQTQVGHYLNLLPPDKQTPFKRLLMTVGQLTSDDRKRLDLPGNRDAEATPDSIAGTAPDDDATTTAAADTGSAVPGAENDAGSDRIATTEGGSDTGIEGGLSERADTRNEDLNFVPQPLWDAALWSGDPAKRPSPANENVALSTTTADGTARAASLNMRRAASAVTKSPEGREWMRQPGSRKANAVLAVMSDALARGQHVDPASVRVGLRVFPGDNGVLTKADLNEISTRARGAKLTPRAAAASDALRTQQAAAANDLGAQMGALREQRAARGEASTADRGLGEPTPQDRALGEGDFDSEPERTAAGPREHAPVGTGEQQTVPNEAPTPHLDAMRAAQKKMRDLVAAAKPLRARQALGRATPEDLAKLDALRTQYAAARADHAAHLKAQEDEVRNAAPSGKERGAAESPEDRTQRRADGALITRMASKLGLEWKPSKDGEREPGTGSPEQLTKLYAAAKKLPHGLARTALLNAVRRTADEAPRTRNAVARRGTRMVNGKPIASTEHGIESRTLAERLNEIDDADRPESRGAIGTKVREPVAAPTEKGFARAARTAEQDVQRFEEPSLEHSKIDDDSLDRTPDDERSVAESVAAAKRNPAYKAIRDEIDGARKQNLSASQRQSKVEAIVKRLAKAFHVIAPQVHFFNKGDFIEHKGELVSLSGDVGMLQRQAGKPPILHLRSDLEPHEMIGVMLHEFGHHLQHSLFDALKADDPVKQRIFADFKKWHASIKGTDTARRIRASRAPFFNTLADLRLGSEGKLLDKMTPEEAADYLTSFSEYFADNAARALSAHGGVQDAVGAFFSHVAHAMKLVYDLFTGGDRAMTDAPKSFHDFINQSWYGRGTPPELEARAAYEAANHLKPGDAAGAEGAPNSPGSTPAGEPPPPGGEAGRPVANDGSRPSDVSHLLNYRDRGRIESLVTRVDVVRKLLTEFPQLRDELMNKATQMDTAVNAAYALWAKGKLQLTGDGRGTGYAGAFRRFADAIQRVFGLKTGAELGERIFDELKNDSYTKLSEGGKIDVGSRQRADYLSQLRARQANAGDAEKAVLNGRIALRRSINYALHAKHTVIDPLVKRALHGLDARMRASNNAAIRQIALTVNRMTGEIGDQEGMIRAIHRHTNQFANQFDAGLGKLTPEEQAKVYWAAHYGRPIADDPKLEAARQHLLRFGRRTRAYAESAMAAGGGHLGYVPNFVPLRADFQKVREGEGDFRAALDPLREPGAAQDKARKYFYGQAKRSGMSDEGAKAKSDAMSGDDMINAFYRMAQSDPALRRMDPNAEDPMMRGGTGAPSGGPSFNPRVMDFLRQAGRDDIMEKLQPFFKTNLHEVYMPYIRGIVHRSEFYRSFVRADADGKQYSLVDRLLDKAKATGASDADLDLARNYVDAQLGTYGNPDGPQIVRKMLGGIDNLLGTKLADPDKRTWEKINNALTTYQNIRVLGLGILGNMIDPLGVWTRTSSLATTWQGYKAAARANWGKSNSTYLRAHAEALGVVERYASNEALSMAFNDSGTPGTLSYKLNHALFHYNGMEMVTRFARLAALAAGHKFLLEHARGGSQHSARYLAELGLGPEDIKADTQHPGFVDASSEKVQKALFQLVDESVVRPHAGHRPLWHADPGMRMLAQYRGFIFSFYDTVMKRMSHEVRNGNVGGVAPMVGYLGVTMAAELAREMIQYGPGGNPERKGWGISDYTLMAAERSGMLGPRADFMNSAYPELGASRLPIPYESLTGPTVSQADQFIDTALGRGSEGNTVLQALPVESIYHGWIRPPKPKNTSQSPGQIAANFADDFVLE